ncbi:hypothetical protein KKE26_00390 [bacterium]|nr:hypothetical protein [bacterium]MBU1754103.1 hypothetical protein [bacterium]
MRQWIIILSLLLIWCSNAAAEEGILRAYSVAEIAFGKIKTQAMTNIYRHMLHDEACDDICPSWSKDSRLMTMEKISRESNSHSQGIFYLESPPSGNCLMKPIAEFKATEKDPFAEEEVMEFAAAENFYAGGISWIKAAKNTYEFIYTEKTDLYKGLIDENKEMKKESLVSLRKISKRDVPIPLGERNIPFISNDKLYVMDSNFKITGYPQVKLNQIRSESITNNYASCSPSNPGMVVFVSGLTGNGDIYLLDMSRGSVPENLRCLVSTPQVETTPQWSPDGNRIVYASLESGNMDIYLLSDINCPSVKKIPLTPDPIDEVNPIWSPNGQRIAFYTIRKGKELVYDLWIMDADGKNKKKMAENVLRGERYGPMWLASEFGSKLIYISGYGDKMYLIDADSPKRWLIETGNKVMSDVACAPYQSFHGNHLIIAYSAQYEKEHRKRIFVKAIKNFREKR